MIEGAELPAVGQIDGDDFARLQASGDKGAGELLDQLCVVGVRDAALAGGVDEGGLVGETGAGFEDDVVDEAAVRVGVELGAEHAEWIVGRSVEVFHVEHYVVAISYRQLYTYRSI